MGLKSVGWLKSEIIFSILCLCVCVYKYVSRDNEGCTRIPLDNSCFVKTVAATLSRNILPDSYLVQTLITN